MNFQNSQSLGLLSWWSALYWALLLYLGIFLGRQVQDSLLKRISKTRISSWKYFQRCRGLRQKAWSGISSPPNTDLGELEPLGLYYFYIWKPSALVFNTSEDHIMQSLENGLSTLNSPGNLPLASQPKTMVGTIWCHLALTPESTRFCLKIARAAQAKMGCEGNPRLKWTEASDNGRCRGRADAFPTPPPRQWRFLTLHSFFFPPTHRH